MTTQPSHGPDLAVPLRGPPPPLERLCELAVPARCERLRLVRRTMAAVCELCDLPEDCLQDLVLAIDEACQNVIRHAYGGDCNRPMVLIVDRDAQHLIIHLQDFAPKVDPDAVQPRDLDDVRPGGLGTHFIREIMDEVRFVPIDGAGNLLRLVKRIR